MSESFESLSIESVNYILCPPEISQSSCVEFDSLEKEWCLLGANLHVLDFKNVTEYHDDFIRVLDRFRQKLERSSKTFLSINMSENILNRIKISGIVTTFNHTPDYKSRLTPKLNLSFENIKKNIIKYLVTHTQNAFRASVNSTVSVDENYKLSLKSFSFSDFDYVATVQTQNKILKLKIRLCFKADVLRVLAARMMQCSTSEVDEEIIQSVATELLNLIYGHAKSRLNDDFGMDIPSAIPALATPGKLKIEHKPNKEVVIIPMVTPLGSLFLAIEIEKVI